MSSIDFQMSHCLCNVNCFILNLSIISNFSVSNVVLFQSYGSEQANLSRSERKSGHDCTID